jgi:hypothetical protein
MWGSYRSAPVIVGLFPLPYCRAVPGKLLNERQELLVRLLRQIQRILPQGLEQIVDRLPAVQAFPHVDAGGVQAKAESGIRVEKNGSVIKLLPEYDRRVGPGFFIHFQVAPRSFPYWRNTGATEALRQHLFRTYQAYVESRLSGGEHSPGSGRCWLLPHT